MFVIGQNNPFKGYCPGPSCCFAQSISYWDKLSSELHQIDEPEKTQIWSEDIGHQGQNVFSFRARIFSSSLIFEGRQEKELGSLQHWLSWISLVWRSLVGKYSSITWHPLWLRSWQGHTPAEPGIQMKRRCCSTRQWPEMNPFSWWFSVRFILFWACKNPLQQSSILSIVGLRNLLL